MCSNTLPTQGAGLLNPTSFIPARSAPQLFEEAPQSLTGLGLLITDSQRIPRVCTTPFVLGRGRFEVWAVISAESLSS